MSLEAVKTISDAEKKAELAKAEAATRCKQRLAQAEAEAGKALEEARQRAKAEAEQVRLAEEEKLEEDLRAIVDNTQNKKAAIRGRAENRLDEAAALIAGRIVNI